MKSPSWKLSFSYAEKQMAAMTLGSADVINKLDKKKVVLVFESVHGILRCDHSNESYKLSSTLLTNPKMWSFKWRLLSGTFLWCILSYRKRLLNQRTQPRKAIDFCTAQPPLEGTWAKTLLVDASQPELGFSHSWAMVFPDFRANRLY